MSFVSSTAKKIAFWTYPRTSWQWDVLCVLILVFIFLTPKSWFTNTSFRRSHAAQTTVVVSTEVTGKELDRADLERRIKQLPGRSDAAIVAIRELRDNTGKLTAY